MPVSTHQLRGQLAGVLHLAGGEADLAGPWDAIVPQAVLLGESDVYAVLRGRHFTDTVIDAWGGLDAAWLTQSVYWALVLGAGLHGYDDRWVERMDLREYLQSVAIRAVEGGPVGHGRMVPTAGSFAGDFLGVDHFIDPHTGKLPGLLMTPDELSRRLEAMATRLGDTALEGLAGPLESMATGAVMENFLRASAPDGTPWPPRKDRAGHPLLRKTGRMAGSVRARATRSGVSVSADHPAALHQRGTRRMPRRVFLGFASAWLTRMAGAVAEYELQESARAFRGG